VKIAITKIDSYGEPRNQSTFYHHVDRALAWLVLLLYYAYFVGLKIALLLLLTNQLFLLIIRGRKLTFDSEPSGLGAFSGFVPRKTLIHSVVRYHQFFDRQRVVFFHFISTAK